MKKIILSVLILTAAVSIKANNDSLDVVNYERECTQIVHWGVMLSTKDYQTALHFAKKAADSMNYEFSSRGYIYSESEMLEDTVICGCGFTHGYIPRGRYDNGEYLSIEIKGDYYVVVFASGDKNEETFKDSMRKAKLISKDAYVVPQEVWMCCMH